MTLYGHPTPDATPLQVAAALSTSKMGCSRYRGGDECSYIYVSRCMYQTPWEAFLRRNSHLTYFADSWRVGQMAVKCNKFNNYLLHRDLSYSYMQKHDARWAAHRARIAGDMLNVNPAQSWRKYSRVEALLTTVAGDVVATKVLTELSFSHLHRVRSWWASVHFWRCFYDGRVDCYVACHELWSMWLAQFIGLAFRGQQYCVPQSDTINTVSLAGCTWGLYWFALYVGHADHCHASI
jgi:hypothetical protein